MIQYKHSPRLSNVPDVMLGCAQAQVELWSKYGVTNCLFNETDGVFYIEEGEIKRRITGALVYGFTEQEDIVISLLYVLPADRCRGLGDILMSEFQLWQREYHPDATISVQCSRENHRAQKFYSRYFEEEEHTVTFFRRPN